MGESETPRQEPPAEGVADGTNSHTEEHELDPTQDGKRGQLENVVRPTERSTHIVRHDSRSGHNEHVHPADRAKALHPVNELERYPLESNPHDPRYATPRLPRLEPLGANLVDCLRGKGRDAMTGLHILWICTEAQQARIWPPP